MFAFAFFFSYTQSKRVTEEKICKNKKKQRAEKNHLLFVCSYFYFYFLPPPPPNYWLFNNNNNSHNRNGKYTLLHKQNKKNMNIFVNSLLFFNSIV